MKRAVGYYEIGVNDLKYVRDVIKIPNITYNNTAVICQQAAEKLLKSLIELYNPEDSILKSYKLSNIYMRVKGYGIDLNLDELELKFLSDFYIDVRYPGDDYFDVDEETVHKCLKIAEKVYTEVSRVRNTNVCSKKDSQEILQAALNRMSGKV